MSDSAHMVALRSQAYYFTGIIYPKVIIISEGYKGTLIAHCNNEYVSYVELNSKEDITGQNKA